MQKNVFFRPKKERGATALTDSRARTILSSVCPVTTKEGISFRWHFVRETRTRSGTIGFVYRDPFDHLNEQIWVVDFASGAPRCIGAATKAKPRPSGSSRQPTLLLPAPRQGDAVDHLARRVMRRLLGH